MLTVFTSENSMTTDALGYRRPRSASPHLSVSVCLDLSWFRVDWFTVYACGVRSNYSTAAPPSAYLHLKVIIPPL